MWGQDVVTGGRQQGKTAFIAAVQEIEQERTVFKRQRDHLYIMLVSVGVRPALLDRILEDAKKEVEPHGAT